MKVIHLLFLFEALFVKQVTGHGYLLSPRSRNFRAHASQDGSWGGGDENTPPAEKYVTYNFFTKFCLKERKSSHTYITPLLYN